MIKQFNILSWSRRFKFKGRFPLIFSEQKRLAKSPLPIGILITFAPPPPTTTEVDITLAEKKQKQVETLVRTRGERLGGKRLPGKLKCLCTIPPKIKNVM